MSSGPGVEPAGELVESSMKPVGFSGQPPLSRFWAIASGWLARSSETAT